MKEGFNDNFEALVHKVGEIKQQLKEKDANFETLTKEQKLELLGLTEGQYIEWMGGTPEEYKKIQSTYEEFKKYKGWLEATTDEIDTIEKKIVTLQHQLLFELGLEGSGNIFSTIEKRLNLGSTGMGSNFQQRLDGNWKILKLLEVVKSDLINYIDDVSGHFDSDTPCFIVSNPHYRGLVSVRKVDVLEGIDRSIDYAIEASEFISDKLAEAELAKTA